MFKDKHKNKHHNDQDDDDNPIFNVINWDFSTTTQKPMSMVTELTDVCLFCLLL